jgi:Flp pilus assembly protein TadD
MDQIGHRYLKPVICCTITVAGGDGSMEGEQMIRKAYASLLDHDFGRAIAWFEEAVRKEPLNADFHYRLSISYARSGRLAQALEHALRACELAGESREYRLHADRLKAMELMKEAEKRIERNVDLTKAIADLHRALELDPLASDAYVLLAAAYAARGQLPRATAALHELLKLNPQHQAARQMLQQYAERLKEQKQ